MSKYSCLILILLFSLPAKANRRQHELDSMLNELSPRCKAQDSNCVKLLVNIAWTYSDINPAEGIAYGKQAVQLAAKLGWEKGEAVADRAIGDCYLYTSDNVNALKYYSQSRKIAEQAGNKILEAAAMGNIGLVYFQRGDYNSALPYIERSYQLNKEAGRETDVACCLNTIANIYMNQGYYPQSLDYHFKALKIFEHANASLNIANTHIDIANIYNYQQDSARALFHYGKALNLYETIGNSFGIVSSYLSIGNVYQVTGDLDRSMEYYLHALKIPYESGELKAKLIGNIATIYHLQKKYEEAIEYSLASLAIFQSTGSKTDIARSLNQLGNYLVALANDLHRNRGGSSVKVEPEIRKYIKPVTLPTGKLNILASAHGYFAKALALSREANARPVMKDAFDGLRQTSAQTGNYQKALAYADSARYLNDSIFSRDNSEKLASLRLQNEYERRRLADSLNHTHELQSHNFKLKQQRLIFYSSIAILILATAGIIWLQSSKIRRERTAQQALFSRQLLDAELKGLRAQMNPHFIFNCLNSIQAMILKENRADASEYLRKFSKLIRMILDNSQKTSNTVEEEAEILSLYLDMEKMRLKNKFDYEIRISESIDSGFTEIPSMVLQPLVENSIWHGLMNAPGKGMLKIEFAKKDNELVCTVEDDGIGLERSKAGKVNTHESKGIKLIRDRLQAWSETKGVLSNVTITDNEKTGTKAVITILYPAYA